MTIDVSLVLAYIAQLLADEPVTVTRMSGKGTEGGVMVTARIFVDKEVANALHTQLQRVDQEQSVGTKPMPAEEIMAAIGNNGLVGMMVDQHTIDRIHEKVKEQGPIKYRDTDIIVDGTKNTAELKAEAEALERANVREQPGLIEEMVAEVAEDARAVFGGTFVTETDGDNVLLTRDDGAVQVEVNKAELEALTLPLSDHEVKAVGVNKPQEKTPKKSQKQQKIVSEIVDALQTSPETVEAEKHVGVQLVTEDDIADALRYFGEGE